MHLLATIQVGKKVDLWKDFQDILVTKLILIEYINNKSKVQNKVYDILLFAWEKNGLQWNICIGKSVYS